MGQEATVRTGHETTDWFQIGKGVHQGRILSPCLFNLYAEFSSLQLSCSVMSDSLRPHESQHARPPCPRPTPGVHSDSRPLSWWCHPAISSSVIPFSSCRQSLPASESSPMSQLFTWGGQRSFSFSIIPSKEHPGLISFRMDWLFLEGNNKSLNEVYFDNRFCCHT